jgi:hypothetical protein
MNWADEGVLAWALADSASAHLNAADRTMLCVKIGAGEHASVIRELLTFYAQTGTRLSRELATTIRRWIDGYAGSDSESTLRHTLDQISVSRCASDQPAVQGIGRLDDATRDKPFAANAQRVYTL